MRRWALGKAHATGEHHELGKASKARYAVLPNRKGASYKRVPLRANPGRRYARWTAQCREKSRGRAHAYGQARPVKPTRKDIPMATKKQQAARAKFAKAARAKGNTKVGRRAKSSAAPKRKRGTG